MITIFTNPRPFIGPFEIIQKNAIKSWKNLDVEIILFEDEQKTSSKAAKEMDVVCIKDLEGNEFGTPLLNNVFKKVKEEAKNDILAYVNADIILFPDFIDAVKRILGFMKGRYFFMCGRRWDLDVEKIDFLSPNWQKELIIKVKQKGVLHGFSGMDYWIFPKKLDFNVPPFAVGRPGMDSWFIRKARTSGLPVIDATAVVTAIHQNHNYPARKNDYFKIEKERNIKLGGIINMGTIRDANWLLTERGLERPPFFRALLAFLSDIYLFRLLLLLKRTIFTKQ